MSQLAHQHDKFPSKKFPIIIITDNVMGDANIGGLFRIADAFSIEKIIFTGSEINFSSRRLLKTARSTVKNVEYEYNENAISVIQDLILRDYTPYALEITNDSAPLENTNFKSIEKVLLIIGNEQHGISDNILEIIPNKTHIVMFGNNSSMNVIQATAIALYEITKTLPSCEKK